MTPEILKRVLDLAVALITLLFSWGIGQRVITYWSSRQKQREIELTTANDFYKFYGQYRAIVRQWNHCLRTLAPSSPDFNKQKDALLTQSTVNEGAIEAILLKLASERVLLDSEVMDLGSLRQAFQILPERIRDSASFRYGNSDDPDYLEFKRLLTRFGTLLMDRPARRKPTPQQAFSVFKEITDNRYELRWKNAGRD